MTGNALSRWPLNAKFLLDEGLPWQAADGLRRVSYPITDVLSKGLRGTKDPDLIRWMAADGYAWITKDDEAKRAHLSEIQQAGISTIWVRGLDRRKNVITLHDLHFLLTNRLERIAVAIDKARGPLHYELYLKSAGPDASAACREITLGRQATNATRRRSR